MLKVSKLLSTVTCYRGEPIASKARIQELQASIGGPYPILRKKGSDKNIGTYISLDKRKSMEYVQANLAAKDSIGGAIATIEVDQNSFQSGDGGIDEAVIATNIANLVSEQPPTEGDHLRIQDRKDAFLRTFGPGVRKYLSDPLLSDPKVVAKWYDPKYAEKTWATINSGETAQGNTWDGESNTLKTVSKTLEPLAEKIRRDPEVIAYFIKNKPEGWVERNLRMNSDGSGSKVTSVVFYGKDGKQQEVSK